MELLPAGLASLFGQLAVGAHNIKANSTLLDSSKLLVDILLPQQDPVDDRIVAVMQLALQHESPPAALVQLQSFSKLDADGST